ncbi:MAG TPA: ATPase domain-containing protein [Thermoplasmata archaeon]|nr:ATPase domain-containing protein [Thermoplasmata archaeon]
MPRPQVAPPPTPAPAIAGPSTALHRQTTRSVLAPSSEDLEIARSDALLQLRIGRSAHYYGILVSTALFFDAFLVLVYPPPLTSTSLAPQNLLFLLFPIGSGVFLSVFALILKWDEYQLWPWELHFWVTVLAVLANGVAAYLYLAGLIGFGPTANWPLVPGLLPLAMGGLSAAMAGFALTWTSRSNRQLVSLVAAILPFPFGFVLFLPHSSTEQQIEGLVYALLASAFFFQISGGFLHLISSGTRSHERELITSGQTRMFVVADELRAREDSLQLREATVLHRQTELEDNELSYKRRVEALDENRRHLEAMEADLRARSDALAKEQRAWAAKSAEVSIAGRTAADQIADVQLREKALEDRLPGLADREARLAAKEGEVTQREADTARASDDIARRLQAVREQEARLDARRADIDRRTSELLREESQLRSRETMVNASDQERTATARRLADLETRETQLNELKLRLDELQVTVAQRSRDAEGAIASVSQREERLAAAEAALATRTAALDQREAGATSATRVAESMKLQYEEAVRRFEARVAEADARAAELDRRLAEIQDRERAAVEAARRAEQDGKLVAERTAALDRRERELRNARAGLAPTPSPAAAPAATEPAPALQPAVAARRRPDRISTGVPRLDDLLLGGLPPKAHALLVGPPFTGKEVLLYQFVGEGLRRGEPIILVAGNRPPAEVTEGVRAAVPEFPDRERQGQVIWVDASMASSSPTDLLSRLVTAAKRAEAMNPGGFRVAVLGAAHLFRGLEEGPGALFFQNFVGILKPRNALALYVVDTGLLSEALLGAIKSRADGVIEFKEERGRAFLAVSGLGDVETRDWVGYRATPEGLVIGSFTLERIR